MSGIMDTLISGIVKSAMAEILKKTGVKASTTKRTKRKTRAAAPSTTTRKTASAKRKSTSAKPSSGAGAFGTGSKPAKKQVSKRRTSTARSKVRRRT